MKIEVCKKLAGALHGGTLIVRFSKDRAKLFDASLPETARYGTCPYCGDKIEIMVKEGE